MSQPKGSPVPILKITPEKVSIDTEAVKEVFSKIGNAPFALYSINGPKRTGKSFMLSHFIRYLGNEGGLPGNNNWLMKAIHEKSFEWRGGGKRHTTGIDIWSEPFWIQNGDKKVALILMDTQGSFDDETTLQQNAIVFAISTLLSSVLIFNIMRDISEDTLQFFQFFSSYATLTIPEDDQKEAGGAFQKLVFLIRDFDFVQDYKFGYYDNKTMPKNQQINYKKEQLDSKPNQPVEVRFVHDQVTSSFQDIGVYLMPEPDKDLKRKDSVENMDEEFVEHLVTFVNLMLSGEIVTKKIGGLEVTGNDMIKYVDAWAKLFDGHDMPEIKSIYHSAAESQFIMAKHMAITFYTSEMQKLLRNNPDGIPELQLSANSADFLLQAKTIYQSRRRLGGKEYDDKFEQEFSLESERLFETFNSTNYANLKADSIRKEMEEKNRVISEEIQKTKEILDANEKIHEEQLKLFIEEIEKGNAKAEDLEQMINRQAEEQTQMLNEIREKEAEIRRVQEEAERAMAAADESGPKIFEKVGEVIDSVVLFPFRAINRTRQQSGRDHPNCTIA